MGRVFAARDPVLDREVAIKLLREDLQISADQQSALVDRMRQEARASARLLHPNIVALFDMGEDPELGLYLVFEYVEGPTLEEEIARGPLGAARAARLARELGDALSTAHKAGVLHRDIKPANVILAKTGAKIADFGIARIPGSTLTLAGSVMGTPAYSAPEAIADGLFSPASDQFSLAATLYEALSGARAFPGDDAVSVAARIRDHQPAPMAAARGLDPHVDRVLLRGMSKRAEERYPSAEELGAELAEALTGKPRAQLPTLPDAHRTDRERTRAWIGAGTGLVIGASLTASLFLLATGREEPRSKAEPSRVTAVTAPATTTIEAPRPRRSVATTTYLRAAPAPTDAGADAESGAQDAEAE
jgi:serine/threonine-protein kinase